MSSNVANQIPFLRTSREFPEELHQLTIEVNRSYIDIANAVNNRTISIFPTSKPSITGESWFIGGQKQQTLRQIYTFTSAGNIPHNITVSQTNGFTCIYGTFTDGTNWYPLPYVDVMNATNQVNVKITPTNIVITAGGGSPPSISSGYVVLEWLSQV